MRNFRNMKFTSISSSVASLEKLSVEIIILEELYLYHILLFDLKKNLTSYNSIDVRFKNQ